MKTHKIAVIAGDGIGPEVIDVGVKVLSRIAELDGGFKFEFTHFPWGCEYYLREGRMMPEDGIDTLSKFDAIFLGAVGYPGVPDHISLRELLTGYEGLVVCTSAGSMNAAREVYGWPEEPGESLDPNHELFYL